MSLERYISVKKKNWRKISFTSKHAVIVTIFTIGFFFGLDIQLLFTLKYDDTERLNNSTIGFCSSISILRSWRIVSKNCDLSLKVKFFFYICF